MAAKIQKRLKYNKDISVAFFRLCQQGHSLTQIATELGCLKEQLLKWSKDPQKYDFANAWHMGKQACQAYHETLLDKMIKQEIKASSSEIEAQKYRLRVMFKEDWSDKQESKVEVSHVNKLSDQELEEQILRLSSRPHIARSLNTDVPALKVVNKDE